MSEAKDRTRANPDCPRPMHRHFVRPDRLPNGEFARAPCKDCWPDPTPAAPEPDAEANRCKNCRQSTHPAYLKRYSGYCLNCSNAGVPDLQARIAELEAERGKLKRWEDAVLDSLAVYCIGPTDAQMADPYKAIKDIDLWSHTLALDPRVSEEAAKLHNRIAELEEKVREYGEEQHRLNKCLEMAGDVRDAAYAELDRLRAENAELRSRDRGR